MALITELFIFGFRTPCSCESLYGLDLHIAPVTDDILRLSFFMLCGLLITIKWIPGVEHSSRGKPKTLEEWAAGRIITERK